MTARLDPETDTGRSGKWLICPVCDQPNPVGTLHCGHCWGASLYQVEPVSDADLARHRERSRARERRRNLAKVIGVGIAAPLLLMLTAFLIIYSFTDAVLPPPPTLTSSPLPGEWTMFRRDLQRTGSVNKAAPAPQGNLKWSFQTDAPVHSSPVVVDGTVFFGSQDFGLYALDAETGQQKWVSKAETWIQSSPAVVDGVVYFGSNDGYVYAVDAASGEQLWRFNTIFPVKSSPAVADGMVYIGSDDYSLYCLDARTGKKLWSYETGSFVMSSPVVAEGIVYAGGMDGYMYALQADNGRFRLRVKMGEVQGSPAYRDEVVYFNSRGGLTAVDGQARNWPGEHGLRGWWIQFYAFRLAPPPPPLSGFLWRLPRLGSSSSSAPVITGDTLYTTFDNRLYAISLSEREIEWTYRAGGDLRRSSPALGNGVLYVGGEDGLLRAVDATTGQEVWAYATGGRITSSPTLVDGVVYVTSHDGKLYAIE